MTTDSKIDQAELIIIKAKLVKRLAKMEDDWAQCGSAWEFIKTFVITHDEHDTAHPEKVFPEKLLYRVMVRAWIEYDVLFIEKSRQLMVSWIIVSLLLWDALFHKHRRQCAQSREIDSAKALVGRARHIYEQLAKRGFPGLPAAERLKGDYGTSKSIKFPGQKSQIMAAPQGGDVYRSYTFSNVGSDEIAFQSEAEAGFTAAIPTVSGGGKYLGVSTPNGKVFNYRKMHGVDDRNKQRGRKIIDSNRVKDKRYTEEQLLGMSHEEFYAIPFEELVACVPGMRFWIMKLDEEITPCLRVHYSADPDRRPGTPAGDAWYARERPKCSDAQWNREQEISYDTFEGRKVIQNWEQKIFAPENPDFDYDPREMLYYTADFGARVCGAIFFQKVKIQDYNFYQIRIIDEILLKDSNTLALADAIRNKIEDDYPETWASQNFRGFCDVAGLGRSAEGDKSLQRSIDIMHHFGLYPDSKKFNVKESTELVETIFALTSPKGDPGVLVHKRCDYAISCYQGGWRYPENDTQGKPEKDGEYDHGGDMTRYGFGNVFKISDYVKDKSPQKVAVIVPIRQKYTGRIRGYRRAAPRRRRRVG